MKENHILILMSATCVPFSDSLQHALPLPLLWRRYNENYVCGENWEENGRKKKKNWASTALLVLTYELKGRQLLPHYVCV